MDALDNELPTEFQPLLDELAAEPESVREMWHYAMVLMMIDDEKARVVKSQQDGELLQLVVRTNAGEEFSIVRPAMSQETEQLLLEQIREIVEEEKSDSDIRIP